MKYRELSRWKYEVMEDFLLPLDFATDDVALDGNGFLGLSLEGVLFIGKGYMWDGASGPTRDTLNTMTPALVHDALYQLIRMGVLGVHRRKDVDLLFYKLLREKGMSWFRAGYFYRAVRLFGGSAVRARPTIPLKEAP